MKFSSKINLSAEVCQIHSVLIFKSTSDAQEKLQHLASELITSNAKLVSIEVFAPSKYIEIVENFKSNLDSQNCPTNIVLPLDEVSNPELAGAHITSILGADVEYSQVNGIKTAVYEAGGEKYFTLFGATPPLCNKSLDAYTESVLNDMKNALLSNGFTFADTVRTWFYNLDILDWYSAFNKGRTKFFNENKVFDGLLPASTGIGSPNPANTPIQCGLFAIKDAAKRGKVIELPSPLQGGATEYGSSFSRAVEINFDTYRHIMISGTASIAPTGETLHFGDIQKQVALTMDVIEQILKSRNMDFSNTISSVVYCMNPQYYQAFLDWQKSKNLSIPHVPSYSTVCRHDLMFEVELQAKAEPLM